MNYRYAIVGGLVGLVLDDTLKALGLHWLVWPVVGLLTVFVLIGALVAERRRSRR